MSGGRTGAYVRKNEPGTLRYEGRQEAVHPTRFVHIFVFRDAEADRIHSESAEVTSGERIGRSRLLPSPGRMVQEGGMARVPESVADFLRGKRLAVAGVSRGAGSAANAVYRKLSDCGYEVFPVNPNASQVEGVTCYPDLGSVPGNLDGVVVVTHPSVSASLVRQAAKRGVARVWLHRSFHGSVSAAAVQECKKAGIACIVGGCPLMYCEPVDAGHAWLCKVLGWFGGVPR